MRSKLRDWSIVLAVTLCALSWSSFAQEEDQLIQGAEALVSSFDTAHETHDIELLASLLSEQFQVEGAITSPDGSVQDLSFDKNQYVEITAQGWFRSEKFQINRENASYELLGDGQVQVDSIIVTDREFPGGTLEFYETNRMIVSIVDGMAVLTRLEARATISNV